MNRSGPNWFARPKGVVAVLETSVLVRAWLAPAAAPNPSRRALLLAGVVYDSFTSPPILDEVEAVLARPRVGAAPAQIRLWLDAVVRASRQVSPEVIPSAIARAVRGDVKDVPILHSAYAEAAAGEALYDVLQAARRRGQTAAGSSCPRTRATLHSAGMCMVGSSSPPTHSANGATGAALGRRSARAPSATAPRAAAGRRRRGAEAAP